MDQGAHTIEVMGLSPETTEKDIRDFFSFCGTIENVDILRAGEAACTAYVTFRNAYSVDTAVLLSGATLLDHTVCITHWRQEEEDPGLWYRGSWTAEDRGSNVSHEENPYTFSAGEAVTVAQDVVKTMLSRGYTLGKDALARAKAFDESHQVSSGAVAKVAELSERIGLTDTVFTGVEAVRSVDQRFHISDTTKSAALATGRTAAAAATTVVNSSYFSKGALWVSEALSRAAKAAADLGTHGINK